MIDLAAFRAETRAWLEENCPPRMRTWMPEEEQVAGGRQAVWVHPDQKLWLDRMAAKGWTAPTWPKKYGGGGLSQEEATILEEEMQDLGCRIPLRGMGLSMLGPTLLEYGTEEQRQTHIPKIISGEIRWCQGYSEPGSGSDLASLSTRAVLQGEHFLVNGHKIWTSNAHLSDWIFCLVRTDPTVKKHDGISFLLIDMDDPGVRPRPIRLISGKSVFCETFFENVRVPKDHLVGELNKGWTIAKRLLEHERKGIGGIGARSAAKFEITADQLAKRYAGGKMYFSLGTALTWPGAGDPDFQYNSGDPNWMIRWDKLELSLYSNTSLVSVANLTATDFFGIRLQLQTFAAGSSTPLATLTTRDTTANVFGDVAAIANHDTANFNSAVVPVTVSNTVAVGVAVPGVGNVLRVIAPSSVPPPAVDDYVSPQAYVNAVQSGSIVTHVTGNYSVQGGSGATQSQSYDFLASIPNSGSIIAPTETIIAAGTTVFNTTTINLNGALIMTGSLGVLGANQTVVVQSADLVSGIISQNPPFYFMSGGTLMYDTFGSNDVYGAAVRDILAGFGFVGSTAINPNTGNQYVNDPTNNWYNPQLGLGVAYSYAQPVNSTFYSQYAAVFAQNVSGTSTYQEMSDAYGFPFTDLLGAPLTNINPNTVAGITITILADDAIAACYAAGTPIMTTLGEVPIEQLATDMAVPT